MALRVLSGPLSNFHDLAANDATTDLLINVITAVGQFQRDIQNELTVEGVAAAEAEGRYRGRPPALAGADLQDVRSTYTDQGTSIAALARAHGVSRAAIRTALADLLPTPAFPLLGPPDQHTVTTITHSYFGAGATFGSGGPWPCRAGGGGSARIIPAAVHRVLSSPCLTFLGGARRRRTVLTPGPVGCPRGGASHAAPGHRRWLHQ
ncbi:hypothetical protein [Actinomadura sp. CNU-125]|uniref:hypothetical protein n=1 Tax=Actinomadura sp. CNU-125 TaxID=1904961 RepID=UPI001652108D|nr:hypothetical protein [Actinomadura sp. CNU-125]